VLALVSAELDLDPASPLFTGDERTLVITTEASPERIRLRLADVADVIVTGDTEVDLGDARKELETRGLQRVLCEGGPSLLGAVTAAGCLDELCLTVAPVIVGGDAARIVAGPSADAGLRLAHVLEEDGFLFTSYVVG
jgi:riboflavin biosynthesis pyrimidine reductase